MKKESSKMIRLFTSKHKENIFPPQTQSQRNLTPNKIIRRSSFNMSKIKFFTSTTTSSFPSLFSVKEKIKPPPSNLTSYQKVRLKKDTLKSLKKSDSELIVNLKVQNDKDNHEDEEAQQTTYKLLSRSCVRIPSSDLRKKATTFTPDQQMSLSNGFNLANSPVLFKRENTSMTKTDKMSSPSKFITTKNDTTESKQTKHFRSQIISPAKTHKGNHFLAYDRGDKVNLYNLLKF